MINIYKDNITYILITSHYIAQLVILVAAACSYNVAQLYAGSTRQLCVSNCWRTHRFQEEAAGYWKNIDNLNGYSYEVR
jgi:hypothetical protein